MPSLLIIDDEPNVCYSLERALQSPTLQITSAGTACEGIESVRRGRPDAVILDVRLPDMSGLEAYALIRQIDARLPVIIITAHGTTETAIQAIGEGAFEYLLKPLDLEQMRIVVARAIHHSRISRIPAMCDDKQAPPTTSTWCPEADQMVGASPPMQELYKSIGRIAPQDVTVLIMGESGTGKELVARAIYQHSRRSRMPLLAINCAAIPESLLESELFGHERGAFTGADRRRVGKFEQAHGGTIFLDEVGDMAPGTQAKVLRLLQENRFERVGGNTTIHSDIRVIAATNQGLESLTAAGRFRQDLFYRLNVLTIRIPPLRERIEDLPLLLEYFLDRMNRELDRQVRGLSPQAMELLMQHSWPGNVRELQSAVKHALVHATGEMLTPDDLPPQLSEKAPRVEVLAARPSVDLDVARLVQDALAQEYGNIYDQVHAAVDRVVLREVLEHVKGNQVEAADLLGISRTTLRAKLRSLNMVVEKQVNSASNWVALAISQESGFSQN
jgi:two-component system nitrogen regulation response regulator GlnG